MLNIKRGRAKAVRMKTFVSERAAAQCLLCFVLALTVTECLPLFETATAASAASSTSPYVEDLLRLYNVSNEDVEASRQKQIATRHSASVNHRHLPPTINRHQQHEQHLSSLHLPEAASPASSLDAQIIIHQRNRSNVTVNMSTRSAFQRKQEVIRNILDFVNQNGRPQMPSGGSPLGPIPPFFSPFSRPDATADLYERTRYLQPSCETPKHTDDEMWSTGATLPLSLHLFFNLSGIQSQTRHGYQLYVTAAKLRLFKFAEGEAMPSTSSPTESADANLASDRLEPNVQTLKAVPFFEPPLHASYEEKIRVSVHNYTRALKRNRVQKKKLLDSQMALAKEEGYMELDIKLAARWWLAPGGRNFGLVIEVEDTDGQRKPITQFFRPRNCSPESGSARSDELTDPANVASPVLELTLIEMPEGKSVFEVPSNAARGRSDDMESTSNDDGDAFAELMDESSPRRHRHQHSVQAVHASQEEQADEAVFRVNNHSAKHGVPYNPTAHQVGKHHRTMNPSTSRLGHGQAFNHRSTPSPVPTLATLEDHDLFRDTEEEETTRAEIDGSRFQLRPTNLFMQRMMQHHQSQQHTHSNSKPAHHSRTKDNRKQ
ncbi:uncharacterized protein LOC130695495 isoform X1 [Daphnia carinata]|uniref:uncharacterized protein LOC130695495 isoform X1 n=1 Tax=Daphnia carinata TaxID=120202 RepID=UPI00257D28D6|nr:uncharacterized protein LOC130695495 isoform X1 [Daphnia carinata]